MMSPLGASKRTGTKIKLPRQVITTTQPHSTDLPKQQQRESRTCCCYSSNSNVGHAPYSARSRYCRHTHIRQSLFNRPSRASLLFWSTVTHSSLFFFLFYYYKHKKINIFSKVFSYSSLSQLSSSSSPIYCCAFAVHLFVPFLALFRTPLPIAINDPVFARSSTATYTCFG